jgi:outer membrane protein OmpA-like peptidoglycan-associated protein
LGQLELYDAKLINGQWTELMKIELKGFEDCSIGHASLSADGNVMYFVSDKKGGCGGTDLYRVTRNQDGSFGLAENLGKDINSEGNEVFPFAYQGDLLLFSSNGHPGLGGLDIFVAKLDQGKVRKVINAGASLNSNGDDFSIFLKTNEMKGYFSSNRKGGKGSDDIYKVTVLTPWLFDKTINLLVKNTKGEPLANAEVLVKNDKGEVLETLRTDEKGEAHTLSTNWELAQLECNFPEYESAMKNFDARLIENDGWVELVAERIPRFRIVGNVLDLKTSKGLDQVKVNFENQQSNNRSLLYTDQSGQFGIDLEKGSKIGDKIKVSVSCIKKGYLPLEETFTVTLNKEGEVNINSFMDLRLEKIEVGKDLGKMLYVKPIYFDLGKSEIRPDAALELDKIVAFMNENPTIEIELGSHTDCRGSMASNAKLSEARAKSSAEYVQSRITNPKRIYGKGYGESKLVNGCACEGKKPSTCTEEEHQANRRTEFKIIKI